MWVIIGFVGVYGGFVNKFKIHNVNTSAVKALTHAIYRYFPELCSHAECGSADRSTVTKLNDCSAARSYMNKIKNSLFGMRFKKMWPFGTQAKD